MSGEITTAAAATPSGAAEPGPDPGLRDWEVLHSIAADRRSCRAFRSDPIPRKTIERILATAQLTASWNNVQSWQVEIATGAAADRFREAIWATSQEGGPHERDIPSPREYAGIYLERRRACGFQLYEAVGVQRGDKAGYIRQTGRNFRLFDAPHIAIITTEEALGTYGAVDCGGYVSNFMLAAESLGVATIAQGALGEYSPLIHEFFDLPENRLVVCGISFGLPDEHDPVNSYRTGRADLADAVTWMTE